MAGGQRAELVVRGSGQGWVSPTPWGATTATSRCHRPILAPKAKLLQSWEWPPPHAAERGRRLVKLQNYQTRPSDGQTFTLAEAKLLPPTPCTPQPRSFCPTSRCRSLL